MIGLYLMTRKGHHVLTSLCEHGMSPLISYVVLAKDKNSKNDYHSEIQKICEDFKIPTFDKNESGSIKDIPVKYQIAVSWRWLIKPSTNLIVLHDSLLPKYRGFNPLVTALLNKDKYIGVTALFASSRADEGEIIAQEKIEIHYPIKIEQAIELIANAYSKIIIYLFENIQSGNSLKSTKQNESKATYSLWRDAEDYFIDWNWSAAYIKSFIDSVGFPYDGAKTHCNDNIITIHNVIEVEDRIIETRIAGKFIELENNQPLIVCGTGLLKLIDATGLHGNPFQFNSLRTRLK